MSKVHTRGDQERPTNPGRASERLSTVTHMFPGLRKETPGKYLKVNSFDSHSSVNVSSFQPAFYVDVIHVQ